MYKIKKKGLEPLIATILLIVVAVILVTIVLAWGKDFAGKSLDTVATVGGNACDTATFSLSNCVVSTTSDTNVYVTNTSDVDLKDFSFLLENSTLDSNLSSPATLNPVIKKGEIRKVSSNGKLSVVTGVKLTVISKDCPGLQRTISCESN